MRSTAAPTRWSLPVDDHRGCSPTMRVGHRTPGRQAFGVLRGESRTASTSFARTDLKEQW